MKTHTYLFEFYEYSDDEVHAIYEDFDAPNFEMALKQFALVYPHGRILNHYIQLNKQGLVA
jgi:hypothetical protein